MKILVNQTLEMENVLSLKGKLTQLELNTAMQKIGVLLIEKDVNKNGNIASTTISIEVVDGEQVMDIEILVPLDKEIDLPKEYTFKKKILITNALKISHIGDPSLMQNTVNKLNLYMLDNNLVPITSGYNVTIKEPASRADIENIHIKVCWDFSQHTLMCILDLCPYKRSTF